MKKIISSILALLFSAQAFAMTINGNANVIDGGSFQAYSDNLTTRNFRINGATGDFGTVSGGKFLLDGTALTGNDYWTNSANGQNDLYANGQLTLRTTSTTDIIIPTGNLNISTGNRVYLDGGTNDYWVSTANGVNELWSNGIKTLNTSSTGDVIIPNGYIYLTSPNRFYLDGVGGNDYWTNSANGQNDLYANGNLAIRTTSTGAVTFPSNQTGTGNVVLSASPTLSGTIGGALAWSGIQIFNSNIISNGVLFTASIIPGNDDLYILGQAGARYHEIYLGDVNPPTANAINANSGVKAYASIAANGTISAGASYNISGNCTNGSAGNYSCTLNTPFANLLYTITTNESDGQFAVVSCGVAGTSTINCKIWDGLTGALTNHSFMFSAFGLQ